MAVLPLRPLSVGELLDAAMNVLRRHAATLLVTSGVLALAEQAALMPLRSAGHFTAPLYLPPVVSPPLFPPGIEDPRWSIFWLMLVVGFSTESFIIGILGELAGRAAGPGLLSDERPRLLGARGRPAGLFGLLGVGLVLGTGAGIGAVLGFLPLIFWCFFAGSTGPAHSIERRSVFGALGRSFVLVRVSGGRTGSVRLLGYLAWYVVRLAIGVAAVSAVNEIGQLFNVHAEVWARAAGIIGWTVANTVAYAALGCIDAVTLLESRMRSEGLDIAVTRALRTGAPAEPIVVGR
jgi:hypothetical protein